MRSTGAGPEDAGLDLALVAGFDFQCRPDCGLCCYAEPAVTPTEWTRLLQIAPEVAHLDRAEGHLPARPRGGACALLERCRCRAHSVRPAPCAEFPLSTHLGPRLQVSLVLSCPGVPLEPLSTDWFGKARPLPGPGLSGELSAVRRATEGVSDADRRSARLDWGRRLKAQPAGVEGLRAELLGHLPRPTAEDVAMDPLPSETDGLEVLPLFFDERYGRVAFSRTRQGVDAIALREGGGIERRLASLPTPDHLPAIDPEGGRLLDGYLAYTVERDAFIGAGLAMAARDKATPLADILAQDLQEISAAVVDRAVLRDWLSGGSGERLGAVQIGAGIRATDADYLDRPTVGRWV